MSTERSVRTPAYHRNSAPANHANSKPANQCNLTRILHVDDDATTREAVRSILSRDHEVVSACGLSDALHIARDETFGLYLLGGMFRDGSSLELCYELRLLDPRVPVLIHSLLPHDLKDHLLVVGAAEVVDKTDSGQELTEAVRKYVGGPSQNQRRRWASSAR